MTEFDLIVLAGFIILILYAFDFLLPFRRPVEFVTDEQEKRSVSTV